MAWKVVGEGKEAKVEVGENGHPLWISDEDGADQIPVEVDWPSALSTISRLNGESKEKREKADGLTTELTKVTDELKLFGELDPKAAQEAIEKLANIDQGALLTADKVESFKTSILSAADAEKTNLIKGYDEKITGFETELSKKDNQIYKLVVSNAFANSPYVKKLQVPVDMVESFFSHYFKVEDGLPVGHLNGNKINSRKNPGNTAVFDEAIEIIVEQYPDKDRLFPGAGGGSGAGGGGNKAMLGLDQIKGMSLAAYEDAKKQGLVPGVNKTG